MKENEDVCCLVSMFIFKWKLKINIGILLVFSGNVRLGVWSVNIATTQTVDVIWCEVRKREVKVGMTFFGVRRWFPLKPHS